ncbi:hypothetical protein [Tsukamurella asaccharolytica]|uniref:hypothetical protein n=1 Tax=Tsukamurella asaccharolytica TaxID=2592067 RepID=UPI001878934A|nr:hypothetical protein [Tsukamurella asaccharolytica]
MQTGRALLLDMDGTLVDSLDGAPHALVTSADCIAFEDSESGIAAAKTAGMRVDGEGIHLTF